jgi:hypothetical protein
MDLANLDISKSKIRRGLVASAVNQLQAEMSDVVTDDMFLV